VRLIAGPPVIQYPDLRGVWRHMRCRTGAYTPARCQVVIDDADRDGRALTWEEERSVAGRCRCEVCSVDVDNTPILDRWSEEQQARPHRKHACPFGSRDAALELLLRWKQDGPSARSGIGGLIGRCEETARLGTNVQTTQRHDRDDLATRRAIYATDIERALRRAFAFEPDRRGLSVDQCLDVMLSTIDTTSPVAPEEWAERFGITHRAVVALIGHGRKRLTIELAVADYIPDPNERDGLGEEIRKRRAEIGGDG